MFDDHHYQEVNGRFNEKAEPRFLNKSAKKQIRKYDMGYVK